MIEHGELRKIARYWIGSGDQYRDLRRVFAQADLARELLGALEAVKADRAYQKLFGAPHFTSAQTEQEWKQESAEKAWGQVDAVLKKVNGDPW